MGNNQNSSFPIRKASFDFSENYQRYFIQGNSLMTHYLNSYSLFIPPAEKSFVRVFQKYKHLIKDPQLSIDVKGFCGQETEHKNQHEKFNKFLEDCGYPIHSWVQFLNWYLEKFTILCPKILQISRTAGGEHLTTVFAHAAFKNGLLDGRDSAIKSFFVWHGLEEMEHNHVAFEVLNTVSPRNYFVRILGYLYVLIGVQSAILIGLFILIRHDIKTGPLTVKRFLKDLSLTFKSPKNQNYFKEIFKKMMMYFKPSFHPRQINDQAIREAYNLEIKRLVDNKVLKVV